jgi:hypothetical protein
MNSKYDKQCCGPGSVCFNYVAVSIATEQHLLIVDQKLLILDPVPAPTWEKFRFWIQIRIQTIFSTVFQIKFSLNLALFMLEAALLSLPYTVLCL